MKILKLKKMESNIPLNDKMQYIIDICSKNSKKTSMFISVAKATNYSHLHIFNRLR